MCALVDDLIDERPLVLGSASPRRRRILDGLGLAFIVDPPQVPEDPLGGEAPHEHVTRLALAKAMTVAGRYAGATVIGADTVVVLDGVLLGKPDGPREAAVMLRSIRGRWHEVLTGVAAVRASDGGSAVGVERTRVLMRDLSDDQIAAYVAGGEPLDKAGAYGIQDCGAAVVERVDGCFYNVAGLPVVRLCRVLADLAGRGRPGSCRG
jgi:septum formation protein